MRTLAIVVGAFAVLGLGQALGDEAKLPKMPKPASASEPARPSAPSGSVFSPPSATCKQWTDGCRVCRTGEDGKVTCSNVGMACQVKEIACTAQ